MSERDAPFAMTSAMHVRNQLTGRQRQCFEKVISQWAEKHCPTLIHSRQSRATADSLIVRGLLAHPRGNPEGRRYVPGAIIRLAMERQAFALSESGQCNARYPHQQQKGEPMIETPQLDDRERGMYGKYRVKKLGDAAGKHSECAYFVLDVTHDPFAIPALIAYAEACRKSHPLLSADLLRMANL